MQLNHTILEALDGLQIEGHMAMTPSYQWNAIPNENGGHSDEIKAAHRRVRCKRLLLLGGFFFS